jgi:hypothetical protein
MPDNREVLGRVVRETWVAWALEQPDVSDHPSWVKPWGELAGRDKEVDMRIGSAVANYALTENAVTWGTSCTSCASVLDSAYAETVRREAAEARLAEVRQTVDSFLGHYGQTSLASFKVAQDLAEGILQVLDREPLGTQGRDGKEPS